MQTPAELTEQIVRRAAGYCRGFGANQVIHVPPLVYLPLKIDVLPSSPVVKDAVARLRFLFAGQYTVEILPRTFVMQLEPRPKPIPVQILPKHWQELQRIQTHEFSPDIFGIKSDGSADGVGREDFKTCLTEGLVFRHEQEEIEEMPAHWVI